MAPQVALGAAARVARGRVRHAGAVATGPAGARRVDARLARGTVSGHVTRRAPTIDREGEGEEEKNKMKRDEKQ